MGCISCNKPYTCFRWTCLKALSNFGEQHVSPRPAREIRNRHALSFCPPIVIPKLMMSLPGPPARAGNIDNPRWPNRYIIKNLGT